MKIIFGSLVVALLSASPALSIIGGCTAKAYFVDTTTQSWPDARDATPLGCRLATISNQAELDEINAAIDAEPGVRTLTTHVGLSRPETCPLASPNDCQRGDPGEGWHWEDDCWHWEDDCTVYQNLSFLWRDVEPDNYNDIEYIGGLVRTDKKIHDVPESMMGWSVYECCFTYIVDTTSDTWANKKANAEPGCRLASVNTEAKLTAVLRAIGPYPSGSYHIGLSRPEVCPTPSCSTGDASEGWAWESGAIYDPASTPWNTGEPNDYRSLNQYTVNILPSGKLDDCADYCNYPAVYECLPRTKLL